MSRLLTIVWFRIYPARFGGQKGVALFHRHLSEHYPVDTLCSDNNEPGKDTGARVWPELPSGKKQFFQPRSWRKIFSAFRRETYSHVLVEFPYYGWAGAWLKRRGAFFILHAHNIDALRFRELKKWWWPLLYFYEGWSMRQADLVLFKTEEDRQLAIKHYRLDVTRTELVPYGIERPVHNREKSRLLLEQQYGIAPGEIIILFAGTLDYEPNAAAVEAIYRQLVPLLEQRWKKPFRVLICGRNEFAAFQYLKAFRHEWVIQAGMVEDITPFFSGADLFIDPVREVHGVQTKIFDALSFDLNTVIFTDAAAGLPSYLTGRKVFVADGNDYVSFAEKMEEALVQQTPTPESFFAEYGWPNITRNFVQALKDRSRSAGKAAGDRDRAG